MRRWVAGLAGAWLLAVAVACFAFAGVPSVLAVDPTPTPDGSGVTIIIPPFPTQEPYPTVVSRQGTSGLAVVAVGDVPGSQGRYDLIAAICLFGFSSLVILEVTQLVLMRKGK